MKTAEEKFTQALDKNLSEMNLKDEVVAKKEGIIDNKIEIKEPPKKNFEGKLTD